jgi:trehalose 6-phosphate phosphatase
MRPFTKQVQYYLSCYAAPSPNAVAKKMMDTQKAIDALLDAHPLAVATDFDGTVSPIVRSPELAGIDPRCRNSLAKLSEELELVAVLSGRPVDEVRQLVGLSRVIYVGNHGLERWEKGATYVDPRTDEYAPVIHGILERARQALKLPGLHFEHKGVSASVHYRLAQDPAAARELVASLLCDLAGETGVRVVEGRRVVELRPPIDLDKGTVLLDLLREHAAESVVYAGDDQTDLDAFRAIHKWALQEKKRALAVGVVSLEMPQGLIEEADLTVEGVEGMAAFLAVLAKTVSTKSQ